ncbi:MAG: hypothetical protein RSB76_00825 [Clostridia bacterium]
MKDNHLNMIQDIIKRMADNSFNLKAWAILIIVAIFTFAGENNNIKCILFTNLPLVVFWCLDTYYLQLERKYRLLYETVRLKDDKDIDYDMSFKNLLVNMNGAKKISYFNCLFSKTQVLFYLTCIITTISIYLFV